MIKNEQELEIERRNLESSNNANLNKLTSSRLHEESESIRIHLCLC